MNSLANTIRITLLIALVTTPWLFGGVWANVQSVLLLATAILMGLELVTRCRPSNVPQGMPTAWLPLLLGILLGVIQLIPWTPSMASWFAGESLEYHREYGSEIIHAATPEAFIQPASISRTLYAAATREQVALLTLGTSFFILASIHFVDRRAMFWICVSSAIGGAGLSFFGIVQRLTWNGKFYWFWEPLYGSAESFGPFVNRNNAGGFLNLCLAASLGLFFWTHSQKVLPKQDRSSMAAQLRSYLGNLDAARLTVVILTISIAGGVLCTASRGSILAMGAAFIATIFALARTNQHRRYATGLLILLIAGVAFMGWAGQTEFVTSRFDQLQDDAALETGRVPNWLDALQTLPKFWGAGTGLGTYRYVYEQFQTRYLHDIAHFHAENQYIQAIVEGGVIAVCLLLLSILLTVIAMIQLYRLGGTTNTMFAITGTYALTSQIVGGCFDFGLYIPANMMLMATICGAVVGRAALLAVGKQAEIDGSRTASSVRDTSTIKANDTKSAAGRRLRSSESIAGLSHRSATPWLILRLPSLATSSILGLVLLGCLFGFLEMRQAAAIARALRNAPLDHVAEMDSPNDISALIDELETALTLRWDDAQAHRHLAALLTQQYRAETYQTLLTNRAGSSPASQSENVGVPNSARDVERWNQSSVWHLHKTVNKLIQEGDQVGASQLLSQPSLRHLNRARQHAIVARKAAPTIPQVHYLLAELSATELTGEDDQIHLQRARSLSPGDAAQWYWTGLLDLHHGRIEQACHSWRRSLELSPQHLNDIVSHARQSLTVEQLVDQILPPQSTSLLTVARRHFTDPEDLETRKLLLARAEQNLEKAELPPAELAYVTGTLHRLQARPEQAVRELEKAVAEKRTHEAWRFELAILLTELQRYDDALEHILILRRESPEEKRFQRLYERINRERYRVGTPSHESG